LTNSTHPHNEDRYRVQRYTLIILDVLTLLSETIASKTNDTVNCVGYKEASKERVQDFTRNRGMAFDEVVMFMLTRLKNCSTATALRRFFNAVWESDAITQQAFSLSRYKIKVSAFIQLFELTVDVMLAGCHKKWHGYRVLAVDGTKIALPDDAALLAYYGGVGRNADSPTAQGSLLYDVLNDIVVDAKIAPLTTDERTLALQHIKETKTRLANEKKLIIGDRGYVSFSLLEELHAENIHYVFRVKRKFHNDIDAQKKSDGYVWLTQGNKRIRVRVIKFMLDSGEEEILVTSITDRRMGVRAFKKLYFMRWPVETTINIAKSKLNIECFTALKQEGIEQDFYATMYLVNVVAAVKIDAQEAIDAARESTGNKHNYKANTNELIGILKDYLIEALIEEDDKLRTAIIRDIVSKVRQHVIPIREGRLVSRNDHPRDVKHHHNRKSNC